MARVATTLRSWMEPLRRTVLHPQWFAYREEAATRGWVGELARGRVLDIGCADGWARNAVSAQCHYIGLDYPLTSRTIYGTRPDVYGDAASLPFQTDAFDTVLLLEVLEHVARPQAVVQEIQRVLKPGGVLVLSVPFLYPMHDAPHDYQRYTAPGLQLLLQEAGFECGEPEARTTGFRGAALLAAIACADAVVDACQRRRWRLLLAPLLVAAIPAINLGGWLFGGVGRGAMLAAGHRIVCRKG